MFSRFQIPSVLLLISLPLLSHRSSAYEIHDTIHALTEENLHLQHRLENLTRALRDLKHLLMEHSRASGGKHEAEFLKVWREWSRHGITTETHHMLQQTLCFNELPSSAQPIFITPALPLFLLFIILPSSFSL